MLAVQVRVHLVRKYEKRVAAGYEWTEGEVEWTPRNTIVYPLICSMAGAGSAMHQCHPAAQDCCRIPQKQELASQLAMKQLEHQNAILP